MDERRDRGRLRLERLGVVPYEPMLALQRQRHAEVRAGECSDTLFLLQHEAVITFGRNRGAEHLLATPDRLAAQGVALCACERGGDVTYHGPGQLVGYPVIALQEGDRDIQRYVATLEEIMIRTAADFDVQAERSEGLRGVWHPRGKLGAVGVRVSNWVTLHGFAFNLNPRLDHFELIVPCGIEGRAVTSLGRILGRVPALIDVEDRIAHHAAALLERDIDEQPATPLPETSRWREAI